LWHSIPSEVYILSFGWSLNRSSTNPKQCPPKLKKILVVFCISPEKPIDANISSGPPKPGTDPTKNHMM